MAKVTALSSDLMTVSTDPTTAPVTSRLVGNAVAPPVAKPAPLQIRIPAAEVKAIKRAALEADQTISGFMLACFHAYMKR
jgi:ubiquinone biosynthesis protein UbiJ